MVSQLLWIEFVLKLVAGVAMAFAPRSTIRLLGLPGGASSVSPFWPRLVGVLLIAIAGASFLQGWLGRSNGLGLAGSALINACLAATMFVTLASRRDGLQLRGRLLFWVLALMLATISVLEVAFADTPSGK